MAIEISSYRKHLKPGATGIISATLDPTTKIDLHGVVVQVTRIAAELELTSGEVPASIKGAEVPAVLLLFTDSIQCACPVIIGKNSSGNTVFLRFTEIAEVMLKRDYFRRDVLIPFYYDEEGEDLETVRDKWLEARLVPTRPVFELMSHGEGSKVLNWKGQDVLLPQKINLSGGGLRFASTKELAPGSLITAHMFIEKPSPYCISAIVEISRSEIFHMTIENRAFYNWAKLRLKSEPIFLTAGKFITIDEKERKVITNYLKTVEE
ncbi:hypothetical protein [Geobacter sp. SVR]|uniref:hypothetical protein n=1 Tax=Geobacter sp. SVR TaxID=2495594 RepID=UPI00143F012F|nr:hypothetical protein [Geobacter sp. SVR]BCS52313.1 pilus protein PilZ [Geobacter sp. SVR]GCF85028.1 pilus protein PilZ [Geobacter sp. SVR]